MEITTEQVKELRDQTGISVMQCKKALEEAGGDKEKAIAILKKQSGAIASKKSGRTLGAGVVSSYIHAGNTVGAMVELLCETDFVAKNDEFKALAYDIAMHVAAMRPEQLEGEDGLLEQEFVKDPSVKVKDLLTGAAQKFGERTEIGQFIRFEI